MASVGVVGLDTEAVTGWIAGLGIDFSGPLSFDRIGLGSRISRTWFAIRTAIAGCYDAHRWGICWPRLTTWRVRLES